jgi:hypothetical protein
MVRVRVWFTRPRTGTIGVILITNIAGIMATTATMAIMGTMAITATAGSNG